jgi:hypothetical protein
MKLARSDASVGGLLRGQYTTYQKEGGMFLETGGEAPDARTREENLQLYVMFAQLRASGTRDYHSLTATYLAANSILLGFIAVILTGGIDKACTTHIWAVSIVLSLMGLWLSSQMFVAQRRLSAQNYYFERVLRIIESGTHWAHAGFFSALNRFMEQPGEPYAIPADGDEDPMQPNFAVRHHRDWWAPRMKSLPYCFMAIFALSLGNGMLSAYQCLSSV